MYKILFHLNDEVKVEDTLKNIVNLLKDIEEEIEVELVVHSKAIYSFRKNKNVNKHIIDMLIDKGVTIVLCRNTLMDLNLTEGDFIPGISIVPTAMGEITKKQCEGWGYIKP